MPDLQNMIELARNLGGILLLVFYASIVMWTYKDARRRIDDPILVATAVATSMLPVVGVLVYMLLRPPEYLADVRERELEIRAMERALGRQERCPYCKSHIESDYRSCPVCMTKLRQACLGCERPLDPRWVMCPFCETEAPRTAKRAPVGPTRRGEPGDGEPRRPRSSGSDRTRGTRRDGDASRTSPMSPPARKPKGGRDGDDEPSRPEGNGERSRLVPTPLSGPSPQQPVDQPTMIHPGPNGDRS